MLRWYDEEKNDACRDEMTTREGCVMTKSVQETGNRAVVAVIAGLTVAQAEDISKAIMVAKDTYAPNGRGTIATGQENTVARMLGDGHNANLPQKKKKKKKKSNKNSGKNKAPKNKSNNHQKG